MLAFCNDAQRSKPMTTIHHDSQLAPADRDIAGYLGTVLNRLGELLSALRVRRRTRGGLQVRNDFLPDDIPRTRTKINPELLRLEWF
jgi:hypothetical protein